MGEWGRTLRSSGLPSAATELKHAARTEDLNLER
jgi:hypothetical protein